MRYFRQQHSGFTLIEIAIVLVIIGLLAGGILKGQQMIENAKYKTFVKEVDAYRAALYAFQDRYKALPGDMSSASSRLPATSNVTIYNGDGDGRIEGGYCGDVPTEESCIVWQHLILAGLISGDPSKIGFDARRSHTLGGLTNAISTGSWISNGRYVHKLLTNAVPGGVAQRYDAEFDDGKASTGTIIFYLTGPSGGSAPAADDTYSPDGIYNLFIDL